MLTLPIFLCCESVTVHVPAPWVVHDALPPLLEVPNAPTPLSATPDESVALMVTVAVHWLPWLVDEPLSVSEKVPLAGGSGTALTVTVTVPVSEASPSVTEYEKVAVPVKSAGGV